MKPFRLPRKTKKKLKGTIWLYPADEKGSSLMAWLTQLQKDYDAVKKGIVRDIMAGSTKALRKKEKALDKAIEIPDEQLRVFVNKVFAKEYRDLSYRTLLKAKNNPRAIVAYYNFINAYYLAEKGDGS